MRVKFSKEFERQEDHRLKLTQHHATNPWEGLQSCPRTFSGAWQRLRGTSGLWSYYVLAFSMDYS